MNDEIYYNKFGNAALNLVLLPVNIKFDSTNNEVLALNSSLYQKSTYTLLNEKFSVDNPLGYTNIATTVEDSTSLTYNFNKYFNNKHESSMTLSGHNLYETLIELYNYIDNTTLNDLSAYNIFSINNEYSIIAGGLSSNPNTTLFYTDWEKCVNIEDINDSTLLNLKTHNDKNLILQEENYITLINAIGEDLYYAVTDMNSIATSSIPYTKCGIRVGNITLNTAELDFITESLDTIGAVKTKSAVINSPNALTIMEVPYGDATNFNSQNIVCFSFGPYTFYTRKANNSSFKIPTNDIIPARALQHSWAKVCSPNSITTWYESLYNNPYYIANSAALPTPVFPYYIIYNFIQSDYTALTTFNYGLVTSKKLNTPQSS